MPQILDILEQPSFVSRKQFAYLIDVQQVRPSVPAPIPHNRPKFTCRKLNHFARTIFREETDHGARAWPTAQPYRQLLSWLPSTKEPKERVGGIFSRYVNPSCVLLLCVEGCCAGACPWGFVRDGDVRIER